MQYQVPQFIETETRILGPFNLRQAIYIVIGGVLEYFIQYSLEGSTKLIATVGVAAIALLCAYAKIDGMTFPTYVVRSFLFILSPKRYLYHKEQSTGDDIIKQITKIRGA